MQTDPQKIAKDYAHELCGQVEMIDTEVFRAAKLLGPDIPLCPVIVSDIPDEDMELFNIGNIFGYKHDGPPIVWNNASCISAYFVWTSSLAALVARQRKIGLSSDGDFRSKLTILAMLVVRKRILCNAKCFPAFRLYKLLHLPLEEQAAVFTDIDLKESVYEKDSEERMDQLVLYRLLDRELKSDDRGENVLRSIIRLLTNSGT